MVGAAVGTDETDSITDEDDSSCEEMTDDEWVTTDDTTDEWVMTDDDTCVAEV